MSDSIIVATTQDHLDVETIQDDLVILKDGICSIVIQASAINFGLLSEEEQDATIYAYAGLLNSLSFPIQIVIKSEKKDISAYLELLASQEKKLKNEVLKERMHSYRQFIDTTITEQNVLDKKFYLIVSYQFITLSGRVEITEDLIQKAKADLEPKRDHIVKQLGRIGLSARQLNSQNLMQLFHSFYNSTVKGQKFTTASDYEQAVVAPNITK
ncbi:MAG: TraC family protein [Microgenomates group bacterium]